MRAFLLIVSFILFSSGNLFAGAEVRTAQFGFDSFIVEVTTGKLLRTEKVIGGVKYDDIGIEGGAVMNIAGLPALPYITRMIEIGDGGKPDVEIISFKRKTLKDINVIPAPEKPKRCVGGEWKYHCDGAAYGSGNPFPDKIADIDSIGTMRGVNIARLSIYPVIFFPKKGEAAVYTHLKIKITLKRKSGGATAKRMPDVFLSVLKKSLLNSWQLRDQAIHEPERILVVAHDSFKGAIQPYIDWKNGIGLKTKLALTSKIGSTKDKLQQFILSEYNSDERPAFILFVGDAEHIPPKWGSDGCASDYMYSQLEGNDLYSDVIIGRFSGKTEEEIKLQVEKVIFYEANPLYGGDGLWLPFGTCISSSEGSGQSNDDYRSDIICGKMEDYGYATDKFYHSKGNDTAYNISTALDEGRGYLCYLGHGSGTSWATTNPPYSNEHVNALENAFKLPIIMDVSCSNGQFAEPSDCLAEAWMKAGTPGFPEGGMGIYSSSTLTAWDEPAEMAIGMIEGLIEAGFHRWGEAALYSRQHVIGKFGAGSNVELVFQQYVLFGDPSLMFRTVPPNELKVAAPAVVPVGNFEFQVDVSDGAAGVGDALVSLKKGDEFALTAYTDETGKAVFQIASSAPGPMKLVVTAFDFLPFESEISVTLTGCGVLATKGKVYKCGDAAKITLWDSDLDKNPAVAETAQISAASTSQPVPVKVSLTETSGDSGEFKGEIYLGNSGINAGHGDEVVFTYQDADCDGNTKIVTAAAQMDCLAPVISDLAVKELKNHKAVIAFKTDEPSEAGIYFNKEKPPLAYFASAKKGIEHEIVIEGLENLTTYYYMVYAEDSVGNPVIDDNGGNYFTLTTPDCFPQCEGKECGPDGCGGECGKCQPDQECGGGKCTGGAGCVEKSEPYCGGCKCEKCVCGMDPYCCDTAWDYLCVGECENQCGGCGMLCVPSCEEKECGMDGCGGECGVCSKNYECKDFICVEKCKPDCADKECGFDGCAGTCGECGEWYFCNESGMCEALCKPDCAGKECGTDGCEGFCGYCGSGHVCSVEGKCIPHIVPDEGVEEIVEEIQPADIAEQMDIKAEYGETFEETVQPEKEDAVSSGGCGMKTGNPAAFHFVLLLLLIAMTFFFRESKESGLD